MNSSGLSGGADQASGDRPAQTEVDIGMKPDYYKAAAKGDFEVFKDIPELLNQLLTPNGNTVLHIHLASPIKRPKDSESEDSKLKDSKPEDLKSSTAFVEKILGMCPALLRKANIKGETPLHIAARYGHAAIVDVLIKGAKDDTQEPADLENGVNNAENGVNNAAVQKMLEMTNNEMDTALHEAVRGNYLKVVERLIEEGKDFSYFQNDAGETPLYMAVERGFKEVMHHILDNCTSPAHGGPLGRTTLHAAVIWGAKDTVDKILEKTSTFITQADEKCWTPLHYAAYFNHRSITQKLLEVDRFLAYKKDAEGMTALHIAACNSHDAIMRDILDSCPDCCELVDNRGWNALHFAVRSSNHKAEAAVEVILERSTLNNLLNEKDVDGNTALHLHSKSLPFIKNLICDDRVDKMAFNKEHLDALDVALASKEIPYKKFMDIKSGFKDHRPNGFRKLLRNDLIISGASESDSEPPKNPNADRKEGREEQFVTMMNKASEFHLVVNTLIATVTFAAGMTMPGGFIGQEGPHPGSAILARNAAFRAFVVTNTIALVQSFSAAFIHIFMPLLLHERNPGDFSFVLALLAFCLTISAIGATVVAFVTGTYAVLMHSHLAIATCVIGLCFFIPAIFITIGCSSYLHELWSMGMSKIISNLKTTLTILCFLCTCLCACCLGDTLYSVYNWCKNRVDRKYRRENRRENR